MGRWVSQWKTTILSFWSEDLWRIEVAENIPLWGSCTSFKTKQNYVKMHNYQACFSKLLTFSKYMFLTGDSQCAHLWVLFVNQWFNMSSPDRPCFHSLTFSSFPAGFYTPAFLSVEDTPNINLATTHHRWLTGGAERNGICECVDKRKRKM